MTSYFSVSCPQAAGQVLPGQGSAGSHLARRRGRGRVGSSSPRCCRILPKRGVRARGAWAIALRGCGRRPFEKLVLPQNGFSTNLTLAPCAEP